MNTGMPMPMPAGTDVSVDVSVDVEVDAGVHSGQHATRSVYHPYELGSDHQQGQQQGQQQQQQSMDAPYASYAQAWTYDTTSVPVPSYAENLYAPAPPAPIMSNTAVATTHTAAASTAVAAVALPPPAEDVSSNTGIGGRSLRKRTASASFANTTSNTNTSNTGSSNDSIAKDDSSSNSVGETTNTSNNRSKVRRKGKDSDGRWSKRFTWPEELHRDFVSAVFDVGLKHASPSTILEHMPKHEQITSERVKSHLQKYRLHRSKSKKEFMAIYEATVTKLQKDGMAGVKTLGGGEVPAHLTYVTMTETNDSTLGGNEKQQLQQPPQGQAQQQPPQGQVQPQAAQAPLAATDATDKVTATQQHQEALMLPRLTEAEKQSPIGASMGYLMGLFFSLKQQLVAQRAVAAAALAKKNQPVAAVFDAFVSGHLHAGADATMDGTGTGTCNNDVKVSPSAVPSMRSNLEENNMMKREMQNQMAFQNKMRALKMQELNKLKTVSGVGEEANKEAEREDGIGLAATNANSTVADSSEQQQTQQQQQQQLQGAGEPAADSGGVGFGDSRNRSMSITASEDFWNTDVVDEQLFEFLMNN
jgi:SHAQKYF class myb-like DNA-binding protein